MVPVAGPRCDPRRFTGLRPALRALAGLLLAPGFPVIAMAEVQLVSAPSSELPSGMTAGGSSEAPAFGDDGRFVVFLSNAANLVTNRVPGGFANLFRRDLVSGATELLSASPADGAGANAPITGFSVSTDGHWVAFSSRASNLVPGDSNSAEDLFIRDLRAGVTRWVSRGVGDRPANGESGNPLVSGDGRFVLFESTASNLVPGVDTNGATDVFLWDRESGETTLISSGPDGLPGNGPSFVALLGEDGDRVVFRSRATSLVGPDQAVDSDLFQWTRAAGRPSAISVPRHPQSSTLTTTHNHCLSLDGRYLAFRSWGSQSSNTIPSGAVWWMDLGGGLQTRVFQGSLHDRPLAQADGTGPVMSRDGLRLAFEVRGASSFPPRIHLWSPTDGLETLSASVSDATAVAGEPERSMSPVLSPDGSLLAFETDADVPSAGVAAPGHLRLYVRTLATGATRTLFPGGDMEVVHPAPVFSPDGRSLVFQTAAVVPGVPDANDAYDVFTAPVALDSVELVSRRLDELPPLSGGGASGVDPGSISGDGRFVAFVSHADDLVPDDSNGRRDVFVRDMATGAIGLVSVGLEGQSAQGDSWAPRISADGRLVAFVSEATNLVAGVHSGVPLVYVRDLVAGSILLASAPDGEDRAVSQDALHPQISANGEWVLFESAAPELAPQFPDPAVRLHLRHLPTRRTVLVSGNRLPSTSTTGEGRFGARLDADARRVAYLSVSDWHVHSVSDGSTFSSADRTVAFLRLRIASVSLDHVGARMAFLGSVTNAPSLRAVYWTDLDSRSRHLIAAASGPDRNAFGNVSISGNGRVVVFDSDVVVPGIEDSNGTHDVFAYDIGLGRLSRLSVSRFGDRSADGPSDSPRVSADGRFVVFRSQAGDLVEDDRNGLPDVFVCDLVTRRVELLSRSGEGSPAGAGRSFAPVLSADGRTALFRSRAGDLVPGDFNQAADLFARVLAEPVPLALDGGGLTADGRLQFALTGPAGVRVVLEASQDLRSWTPVATNVLPATVDLDGVEPERSGFYRTVVAP